MSSMVNRALRATLLSLAVSGFALSAPLAVQAQQPAAPAPAAAQQQDPVVARVNGEAVHASDVMRLVSQLPPQVQQMPLEMIYPAILDQLVNQKLVSAAGYKAGLQNSAEVKDELKRAEERIVQRAFIQGEVEKRITKDALDKAYKEYVEKHPAQEEVKAAHILVDGEAEAKDIIAQLKKGGDFAKLAKEKSKDKAAAEQGGDLGYFTKDMMVEPFANAAFAMKKGEVSKEPVKTQFGYHVIKVEDRRKAPPPAFEEMADQLREEMAREVVTAQLDQLRSGAKIEKFAMDGSKPDAAPAKPAATPNRPAPAAPKQ
jgi:peptidyl-prolyl cis-trans isomerase C